jgi:hypothetical protein
MLRWTLIVLAACDAGTAAKPAPKPEPPRTAVAPPVHVASAPPPARHKHGFLTVDLSKPDLGDITLPKHGVVIKTWGMGGDGTLILDRDAGTLRELTHWRGKPPGDHRRTITTTLLDRAMARAYAAWDEEPNGEMPVATDVREDLYVLDDDEAFYLSGFPIGANGTQGRPAAAQAMAEIYALAPDR